MCNMASKSNWRQHCPMVMGACAAFWWLPPQKESFVDVSPSTVARRLNDPSASASASSNHQGWEYKRRWPTQHGCHVGADHTRALLMPVMVTATPPT
jgi:hypothetical protein